MTNTVDELKRVRRLFFALTLPDAMQQEIVQWRAGHFSPEAGRPVAAANLHLTLAFLGEVSATNPRCYSSKPGVSNKQVSA